MSEGRRNMKAAIVLVVWVALAVGLFLWIGRLEPEVELEPGWAYWPEPGATRALVVRSDGVLAGGLHGLFRIGSDGKAQPVEIEGTDGVPFVYGLLEHPVGTLWVGHDQGLSIRRDGKWHTWSERDGVPAGGVAAFSIAPNGEVWMGTQEGIVIMSSAPPWSVKGSRRLSTRDGVPADKVSAILHDREGGVWVGTYSAPQGGAAHFGKGAVRMWTPSEGLPHPNVTSICQVRDGRVWVGCGYLDRGGAVAFSETDGEWRLVETLSGSDLVGPKVRSIHEDAEGFLWLGSETSGLTIRRGNRTLGKWHPDEGFPISEGMCFAESADGAMWLGTLKGLFRFDASARRRLTGEGTGTR